MDGVNDGFYRLAIIPTLLLLFDVCLFGVSKKPQIHAQVPPGWFSASNSSQFTKTRLSPRFSPPGEIREGSLTLPEKPKTHPKTRGLNTA